MKIIKYICDECEKQLNCNEVFFFNYKDKHLELCKKDFEKYKEWRKQERLNKEK